MRIAAGSDERNAVTDWVLDHLRSAGHDVVSVIGPMGGGDEQWADVGRLVAEAVAAGEADEGIVFCSTGTGVSIAANKVRGIRAALCTDAEQARGARKWNDANVLALSLQLTDERTVGAIIDAWLDQRTTDPSEAENIAKVEQIR